MAGQPVIAANAPTANPMNELAMMQQGYGPATTIAAQHSQYLAQALAAMREQGQQIRTPVALGSDLLAQALLQRKYGESIQDFAKAAQADRAARFQDDDNWAASQLSGGHGSPPAAPAASPTPDASTPPPPPTPQNTVPAQPAPDYAPNFGDPHQNPAAFFTAALDGKPVTITSGLRTPAQNQAVGGSPTSSHLTGNAWDFTVPGMTSAQAVDALRQSGMPFDQIIDEGRNVHVGMDPRMRGMVMAGNGGRYNVVDHDTFGAPQPPADATAAQIATGHQGTQTPLPSPGAGPSPAPGGTASAAPAAASPAAGAAAPMYAPVTPQQIQLAQRYLHSPYPQDQQLGHQMMAELRQRSVTQIESKGQVIDGRLVSYDPYGRTAPTSAPIPGMGYGAPQDVPGLAGKFQTGPDGKLYKAGDAPYGAPGSTPGVQGVTQTGPDGQVHVVGQSALPAERVLEMRGKFFDSDVYKKFAEGRSSLVGFRNAVGQMAGLNNGVLDTAAVDSYLRSINPGMGARNTTVQMFLNHLGLPQEIQGHILAVTGNGYITPQSLQQMDRVMQSYVAAHGSEVQHLADSDASLAKTYGLEPKALGEDFGDIPQPATLNFGGRQSPAQAGASASQTAQTAGTSVANAAANLPRLSPQDAAKLPPGTRFVGLDGHERVHH